MTSTEILNLSPWDFDQSPNGWRMTEKNEGAEAAIAAILEFLSRNMDRINNQNPSEKRASITVMYFHLGQLYAQLGSEKYSSAIEYFQKSLQNNSECWNAYVNATIGFLKGDKETIKNSIQIIENTTDGSERSGNIGIVKDFLKVLDSDGVADYGKAYSMPRES